MYSSSYSSMNKSHSRRRSGSISATKSRLVSTSSASASAPASTSALASSSRGNGINNSAHTIRSSTPLAALADKFERFKRRIKSSSKKDRGSNDSSIGIRPTVSEDSRKSLEFSSSSSMDDENFNPRYMYKKKSAAFNAHLTAANNNKGQPKLKNWINGDSNASNNLNNGGRQTVSSKSTMDVDDEEVGFSSIKDQRLQQQQQHDAAYNQVMEGMIKMSSSSDGTTVTANSTQPSFSIDDGSTIGTEDTSYAYHSFQAGKEKFTVDKRYSMIRTIGSGAYGSVISAKDFNRGSNVAIKMVPRAFHDEIDAKRILREIKLLKHFRHENIISILDMMPPIARYVEDFNDVYIVTDLMETDLHRIIYSKQSLSIDHVQYFLYQVLRALKYIHSANVLHRDLKPSNLLVNSNCDLKVCDFGLARGITSAHDKEHINGNGGSMLLTEYVVTRWYRAPEIMLACHEYSKPSDVWSVGCIFAELLGRKPFFPGDDYIDQLTIISEKLGKLPEEDLDFVTSDKAKRFMRKLPNKKPTPLSKRFPNANPEGIDLLKKMLQIHPCKRISVVEALAHPFFSSLHNESDEPVAHSHFDFTFEEEKLNRVRLQELIWKEIGDFRPSCLPVGPRRDGSSIDNFRRRLYSS